MAQARHLFVYFRPFLYTMANIVQNLTIKVQMVFLGFKPGTVGWQVQTKPLSYAGPFFSFSRITFTLNVGTDRVNPCMCDQIWQNYATFGKIIPLLAKLCHFWQFLVRVYFGIIWQKIESRHVANFFILFYSSSLNCNWPNIEQKPQPSDHTDSSLKNVI